MSGRYTPTPLHRMLAHVEALGLGHRPDPDDPGRHFSTCPVCGRMDSLVIYEPDDGLPVRLSCRARCHPARIEQALADGPERAGALEAPNKRALDEDPETLRRRAALLLQLAAFIKRRRKLKAVA